MKTIKDSSHVRCFALCTDLLRNCNIGFAQKVLIFAYERRDFLVEIPRRLNAGVGTTLYEFANDGAARKIGLRSAGSDCSNDAHVFGLETAKSK